MFNNDKQSLWKVVDNNGIEMGFIKTETYLDIIDVVFRAQRKFGVENPSDFNCHYVCDV